MTNILELRNLKVTKGIATFPRFLGEDYLIHDFHLASLGRTKNLLILETWTLVARRKKNLRIKKKVITHLLLVAYIVKISATRLVRAMVYRNTKYQEDQRNKALQGSQVKIPSRPRLILAPLQIEIQDYQNLLPK